MQNPANRDCSASKAVGLPRDNLQRHRVPHWEPCRRPKLNRREHRLSGGMDGRLRRTVRNQSFTQLLSQALDAWQVFSRRQDMAGLTPKARGG
jgi:hypothetical protein